MAPRPIWKGYLRLSLVSCPICLYPATSQSERISFHLLNPKTHNRVNMRLHDAESDQQLERGELVRGYELSKGQYVIVTEKELDAIEIDSSKTVDLMRFVDPNEVDVVYLDTPYYVAPDGKIGDETFRVIREAMDRSGKAGIGRVVLTNREHPLMLRPHGKGLVMITLRPADEVRADKEYFKEISESKLDEEMVNLAVHIIEQKSGHFDPKELAGDRYQEALRHLVDQKVKGEKPVIPKAAKPAKVINLMDALRRSLEAESVAARKPAAPGNRRRTTLPGGTPPGGPGLSAPRGRTSPLGRRRV
jgi:DNA end-binding protein Ku